MRLVVLGALVALVLGFAVAGSRSEPRHLGAQGGSRPEYVAVVPAGTRLCQSARLVPAGTANLGLTAGTYGAPGPRLTTSIISRDREVLVRHDQPAGWRQGNVEFGLGRALGHDAADGRLCISNRGPGRLALAGQRTDRHDAARIGRRGRALGMVSVEYLDRGESFWTLAGDISDRLAAGRSFWGAAALPLAVVLILLTTAISVGIVLRADRT